MLFSASRTQKVVSLSSAEAEVYACSGGASDSILLAKMLSWLTVDLDLFVSILQRLGVGRLRHLSCRVLWLQSLIAGGAVKLCSVSGHVNPADIGTKRLSSSRLRALMSVLGLFNHSSNSLEGSDDPGRVFVKRHSVRAKGCAPEDSTDYGWTLMAFSMVLGLIMMLPLITSWFNSAPMTSEQTNMEFGEPMVSEPPLASSSAMLTWMYERCMRGRSNASTDARRGLYDERLAVVREVITGISVIESTNALDDAERAYEVANQLAGLASATANPSSCSGSAHVDAVANSLIGMMTSNDENAEEEERSSSDVEMETQSERRRRYMNSGMCECSDPDEWMLYHRGRSESDESDTP
eukprot:s822_g26.t1